VLRFAQDEVNQEESEQNAVDGMKKGADRSAPCLRLLHLCSRSYRGFPAVAGVTGRPHAALYC